MVFLTISYPLLWSCLASAHAIIRQAGGFTPYATCSADCMNDITQSSIGCNQVSNDCICDINDTYLEETAQCIAIRCGAAELTATANLGVQNCALTGGWGNIDNNPNNFIYMGMKAISSSQSSECFFNNSLSHSLTYIPLPRRSITNCHYHTSIQYVSISKQGEYNNNPKTIEHRRLLKSEYEHEYQQHYHQPWQLRCWTFQLRPDRFWCWARNWITYSSPYDLGSLVIVVESIDLMDRTDLFSVQEEMYQGQEAEKRTRCINLNVL